MNNTALAGIIVGAVVVEETTGAIQLLKQSALEQLLVVTLAVVGTALVVLLAFATRLATRIRRLHAEAERAIDSHGVFTDGRPIDGAAALREALLSDPSIFVDTVTQKLMTYALGRGLQYYDMPVVRRLLDEARDENYRFSEIVIGIVESAPFRMRARSLSEAAQDSA